MKYLEIIVCTPNLMTIVAPKDAPILTLTLEVNIMNPTGCQQPWIFVNEEKHNSHISYYTFEYRPNAALIAVPATPVTESEKVLFGEPIAAAGE